MLPSVLENDSKNGLHYYYAGQLPCQLFFVHGLLGNGKNWQTFLKILQHHKGISCCSMDLRGHGNSTHFSSKASMLGMAKDVISLIQEIGTKPVYLIGHSLGGKLAIQIASMASDLVQKLMIVDIGLDPIPTNIPNALDWMSSVPTPIMSLENAKHYMQQFTLEDTRLCDFLVSNLVKNETGTDLRWRVDIAGLRDIVIDLQTVSLYEEWRNILVPITLVRGSLSNHLTEDHVQKMVMMKNIGQVQTIVMSKSGHWCHADEPQKFRGVIETFID